MRTSFARVKELAGADSEKFAEEEVRKSRERLFALYACIRAPVIRDPVARRRHGNGEKVGFCPQKRAKSGICGSSRRDLPTCASACVIERKRRLSRGLRRSGESCGALFGRYDLPWRRALTQKFSAPVSCVAGSRKRYARA